MGDDMAGARHQSGRIFRTFLFAAIVRGSARGAKPFDRFTLS
jgi:hypothetical protein